MKSSRLAVAAVATLLTVACANNDKAAADSAAAAAATLQAKPAFSLADVAGQWQVKSTPTTGKDTTTNTYVLTATADTTGWKITYPSKLVVPLHVALSGDSIMLKTGVYSSQRRKGVKVMTEGVARLQGGKWVGMNVAHYQGQKDSVAHVRTEGTRIP